MTEGWWKKFPGVEALGGVHQGGAFDPDSIFLDPMIAGAPGLVTSKVQLDRHLHARAARPGARRPDGRHARRARTAGSTWRSGSGERRRVPLTNSEWKARGRRRTRSSLRTLFADEIPGSASSSTSPRSGSSRSRSSGQGSRSTSAAAAAPFGAATLGDGWWRPGEHPRDPARVGRRRADRRPFEFSTITIRAGPLDQLVQRPRRRPASWSALARPRRRRRARGPRGGRAVREGDRPERVTLKPASASAE